MVMNLIDLGILFDEWWKSTKKFWVEKQNDLTFYFYGMTLVYVMEKAERRPTIEMGYTSAGSIFAYLQ